MAFNEQQLSALIDAAVREAVERTTRELNARHEADTEGLRRKRDELLDKVTKKEGDKPKSWNELMADFDKELAGVEERLRASQERTDRLLGKTTTPVASDSRAHTITREAARDARAYQEAKARAKAAGVELEIVDGSAPAPVKASPVRFIHDAQGGILHANKRLIETIPGGLPRLRQLAAEKNAHLRLFKTVDELPTDAAAKHAEIIASQDRTNLLGDQ